MSKPKKLKVVGYNALGLSLVTGSDGKIHPKLVRLVNFRRKAWRYLNPQERRNLDDLIANEQGQWPEWQNSHLKTCR